MGLGSRIEIEIEIENENEIGTIQAPSANDVRINKLVPHF